MVLDSARRKENVRDHKSYPFSDPGPKSISHIGLVTVASYLVIDGSIVTKQITSRQVVESMPKLTGQIANQVRAIDVP